MVPEPPLPVEVTLRAQGRSFGCLWAMCVPMGLLVASVSTNANTPLYGSPFPLLFGVAVGGIPLILTFSRRFAVAKVDARGLTLRSGKLFLWADLRGINKVQVLRNGRQRTDYAIGFKTGGVRIRAHEYVASDGLWRFLEHVEKYSPRV